MTLQFNDFTVEGTAEELINFIRLYQSGQLNEPNNQLKFNFNDSSNPFLKYGDPKNWFSILCQNTACQPIY